MVQAISKVPTCDIFDVDLCKCDESEDTSEADAGLVLVLD